jgi:BA14K-like protein
MEPIMITLRVLSTAAAMALLLPMAAPTASFAENPKAHGGSSAGVRGGGGGGAPVARFNGGGGAPVARFNAGGGSAPVGAAPVARFNGGGGGAPVAGMSGGGGAPQQGRFSDGRSGWRDGDRSRGGFGPGFAAGAIIGGAAIASQSYGYYDGPGYYAPGYYDDQYYDQGTVALVPAPGGDDAVAYCMQTYRSYDPASGTYLGFDGYRHPCP